MKILVSGLGGHMGAEVAKLCQAGCRGAVLTAELLCAQGYIPHK